MKLYKTMIKADLHTHTVFSKHAYSTVKENTDSAFENNMSYVAVTDHFFQCGGDIENKNEIVRMCYVDVARPTNGIKLISGGEFNIAQDISGMAYINRLYKNVKWRLIGIHSWFLDIPHTHLRDIPAYFEAAVKDDRYITPTAFAHIEREIYKCIGAQDKKLMRDALFDIVDIAVDNGIILEVNESSINNDECGGVERMKIWLNRAKERGALFSLGSDAHYCTAVGVFEKAVALLNELEIPPERIINTQEDFLKKFLKNT